MEEPFIMAKTFYTFGTRCPLRTMSSTFLSRPRALAPKGSCTLTSLSWRHFIRQMALPIIGSINSSETGEHLLFSVFLNGPSGFFKQTSMSFFQPINVTKCPSYIRCWDSNPLPSDYESHPITTRPGLPPFNYKSDSYCLQHSCGPGIFTILA